MTFRVWKCVVERQGVPVFLIRVQLASEPPPSPESSVFYSDYATRDGAERRADALRAALGERHAVTLIEWSDAARDIAPR